MDFLSADSLTLTLFLSVLVLIIAGWVCFAPGWVTVDEKSDKVR